MKHRIMSRADALKQWQKIFSIIYPDNGELCKKFGIYLYYNRLKNDIILSCGNRTSYAYYWKAAL